MGIKSQYVPLYQPTDMSTKELSKFKAMFKDFLNMLRHYEDYPNEDESYSVVSFKVDGHENNFYVILSLWDIDGDIVDRQTQMRLRWSTDNDGCAILETAELSLAPESKKIFNTSRLREELRGVIIKLLKDISSIGYNVSYIQGVISDFDFDRGCFKETIVDGEYSETVYAIELCKTNTSNSYLNGR